MNYNKGDLIMMLGINAPKPLVKGEFAKADEMFKKLGI